MEESQKKHIVDGTTCLIKPWAIEYVGDFLKHFAPEMIIELGTYMGGFTKHLTQWFPDVWVYSFDNEWRLSKEDAKFFSLRKVILVITDIFKFKSDIIFSILSDQRKKFLFCDNGAKLAEMKRFGPRLLPGDLMGVHDWGTEVDREEFYRGVYPMFQDCSINDRIGSDSELRFFTRIDEHAAR